MARQVPSPGEDDSHSVNNVEDSLLRGSVFESVRSALPERVEGVELFTYPLGREIIKEEEGIAK
jgi:hypothetical protein